MTPEEFAKKDEQFRIAIKALESERAILREQFANEYSITEGDQFNAGSLLVSVQRNAVFNATVAKSVLNQDEYESICVLAPQSAQAKRLLSPARYEQCQKVGAPKIVVTKVED